LAYLMNFPGQFTNGGERTRFNRISEAGSEAYGAQHAKLIFRKALTRVANGAKAAELEGFASANVIQNLPGSRIKQQAINSKVAALHISPGIAAELHLNGMAAVRIAAITAKRGYLNGVIFVLAVCAIAENWDEHHAKLHSDGVGLWEQAHHVFRRR